MAKLLARDGLLVGRHYLFIDHVNIGLICEQRVGAQRFVVGNGSHILLTKGRAGRSLDFGEPGNVFGAGNSDHNIKYTSLVRDNNLPPVRSGSGTLTRTGSACEASRPRRSAILSTMVFDGLLVLLGYAFFFEAVWLGLQRAGGNRIPIGWRASREHESGSSWGARSWCMLAGVIFMTLGGANAQVRFIGSWAFLVFVPVILINVIPVLVHNRRVDARASALSHPIL